LVRDAFLEIYPYADYHEIICDYGDIYKQSLPSHIQDKLTDKIWYSTWRKVGKQFVDRHISGVRGKESSLRAMRMSRWGTSTERTCAPIGYWSTSDVYAYLYKYNLPVHPNYAMLGGGRWNREYIRTAEIGDIHGNGIGRTEWEQEYYPDILARIHKRNEIGKAKA
jgi:phosphoadenosine phosphosulfate reductase